MGGISTIRAAASVSINERAAQEHGYLIARGVRALALVGHCVSDPVVMLQVSTRLETLAEPGTVPFVIERGDGQAEYGYASAKWVVDLYRWLGNADISALPDRERNLIAGLLFGYSVDAIRQFDEAASGRCFHLPPPVS